MDRIVDTNMAPTLLLPREVLMINLENLTQAELHELVADDRRRHSPPWIYVFCVFWLLLMFTFGISKMLPPRFRISHFARLPDRFFWWAPGKVDFDLKWQIESDARKKQEEEERGRVFTEQTAAPPPKTHVGAARNARDGSQMEDIELRMMTPLEQSFARLDGRI
jgi:hypothetical protein